MSPADNMERCRDAGDRCLHKAALTKLYLQIGESCLAPVVPVRFSPCSPYLMAVYFDGLGLRVLDADHTCVHAWPSVLERDPAQYDWDGICHTWTPSGMLVAGTRLRALPQDHWQPPQLEVCWHRTLPEPQQSAEAIPVQVLLAGNSPREDLKELTWSPIAG